MKIWTWGLVALSLLLASSCGGSKETYGNKENSDSGFVYYVGDGWSKREVDLGASSESSLVQKVLKNILSISKGRNVATGIYVGHIDGIGHLVATNHHIISSSKSCGKGSQINFQFVFPKKTNLKCKKLVFSIPEIDLSIVSLDTSKIEESVKFFINKEGFHFSKGFLFSQDHQLITAGFGVYKNQTRALKIDDSSECRLISEPGETRQLQSMAQASAKVWSIAIACDISIGDSGSPVIDVQSGKLVGMVWSGVYPKFKDRVDLNVINKLKDEDPARIWDSFNYAVPTSKIEGHFTKEIKPQNFDLSKMLERTKIYHHLFR